MTKRDMHRIFEAIKILNWHYGRGDLHTVDVKFSGGRGLVIAKCPGCKPHTFRFRYEYKQADSQGRIGITVKALRHQRTMR